MKFRVPAISLFLICGVVSAQKQKQNTKQPPPAQTPAPATAAKPAAPAPASSQRPQNIVEEIVARVNGEIITSSDLMRSQTRDIQDAKDDCTEKKCSPEDLQKAIDGAKRDTLRNLIDTKLLVQRAKDLNMSAETEVVRQLDETRVENKFDSMEALQKAVENEGMDWDDYKDSIRSQDLARDVVYREVGSKVAAGIDRTQVQKYYNEHKDDFVLPEGVRIREILVSTEGKPESEWPALEKKAEQLRDRVVKNGEDFGELAKHFSDAKTAHDGGELGGFERGKLSKQFEDAVFKLNRNEMTPVMQTTAGYMILQVEQRYEAGVQPLDKIENEVTSRIASSMMPPKLRDYLTTLRRDSFLEVRPGYVDSGATGTVDTTISEAKNPLDEPVGKLERGPKKHKKLWIF